MIDARLLSVKSKEIVRSTCVTFRHLNLSEYVLYC